MKRLCICYISGIESIKLDRMTEPNKSADADDAVVMENTNDEKKPTKLKPQKKKVVKF